MTSEIDFDETLDEYLIRIGGQTNKYGGIFQNGTSSSIDKRNRNSRHLFVEIVSLDSPTQSVRDRITLWGVSLLRETD